MTRQGAGRGDREAPSEARARPGAPAPAPRKRQVRRRTRARAPCTTPGRKRRPMAARGAWRPPRRARAQRSARGRAPSHILHAFQGSKGDATRATCRALPWRAASRLPPWRCELRLRGGTRAATPARAAQPAQTRPLAHVFQGTRPDVRCLGGRDLRRAGRAWCARRAGRRGSLLPSLLGARRQRHWGRSAQAQTRGAER